MPTPPPPLPVAVSQAFNATAELAAADDPAFEAIRVMTVGTGTSSHTPLSRLGSVFQPWAPVSSKSLGVGNWTAFSAVCWFTGRDVFEGLNRTVPLGLISNNWGGTPIEYWSPSHVAVERDGRAVHRGAHGAAPRVVVSG